VKWLLLASLFLAGSVASASAPAKGISNIQIITQQEIERTTAKNAYEVVRKLRPSYLVSRGEITINAAQNRVTPNIYLNGQLFGAVETLASIPVSQIAEIRLYHAGEAPVQWEQNNPNGLIAVETR
jgi:hypothetical protein